MYDADSLSDTRGGDLCFEIQFFVLFCLQKGISVETLILSCPQQGLGQHFEIKHINIPAAKYLHIHTKWGKENPEMATHHFR